MARLGREAFLSILMLLQLVSQPFAAEAPAIAESSAGGDEVRLNQIQVIGTHNSYHIAPHQAVLDVIAKRSPELARSLDYTHRPLAEQFSRLGIRQIELDIFADPNGGLYAEPLVTKTVADAGPPHDPEGLLRKPGMKILHVQDIDYRTTALTLVERFVRFELGRRPTPVIAR